MSEIVTAGILVIGDEILSGRTKDKNIGFIAEYLTNIGIDLKEVRVVADDEADIISALDALRHRYTYVFTTGGIGPTHDDITADSVAKAFGGWQAGVAAVGAGALLLAALWPRKGKGKPVETDEIFPHPDKPKKDPWLRQPGETVADWWERTKDH